MTDPNNSFETPVGRLVGGSLSEPQTRDHNNELMDKPKWVIILALPKSDPGTDALITQIKRIAAEGFSKTPKCLDRHDFAWKFIDGDSTGTNTKGVVWNERDGYPGHYVFTISTPFAFPTCGKNPADQINAATVKKGSYIRIAGNIKSNEREDQPGVYLNLECAQFIREGEAIAGAGRSTMQAFGSAPATPVAFRGGSATATATPAAPTPTVAHDIVTNVAAPPPPPPPDMTGPALTEKGIAAKCVPADWIAQGWTPDTLRSGGYIV